MDTRQPIEILAPSGVGRRTLLAAAAALGGGALGSRRAAAQAAPQLNLFTWETYGADKFVEFSAANQRPIRPTFYSSSDEMMAKLRGGGGRLYDAIVPIQSYVPLAVQANLIEPMDKAKFTNIPQLFPAFVGTRHWEFNNNFYGVPFVWGANAIAFNRAVTGPIDSLDALFDPRWRGRIAMRDEPEDSLAIGALKLGIRDPYRMDERQLQEVKRLLIAQKPLVRAYWRNIAEQRNMLASGEVVVSWAFLAVVKPLRDAGIDAGWVWPKEGAIGWNEGISLVRGSRNRAAVEAYGNFTLTAEYGMMMARESRYATTSKVATDRMEPAMVEDLGIDPAKVSQLVFKETPENKSRWNEIWNEVKNA